MRPSHEKGHRKRQSVEQERREKRKGRTGNREKKQRVGPESLAWRKAKNTAREGQGVGKENKVQLKKQDGMPAVEAQAVYSLGSE